jgi:L-aminopeptidase/D-esterase-like protein
VSAVLLTGGSAFGLAAADGVMRWLAEREVGFETRVARVPIVPAAVLFDLDVGDPSVRPGAEAGYAACESAEAGPVEEGSVGAGAGASVAKLNGPAGAVKGGVGTASAREGALVVGALFAVNAVGEILGEDGETIAASRVEPPAEGAGQANPGMNTVIGVVATNARLSKERAHLLAIAAHDAFASAVRPAHTPWDGDTVFTLATGQVQTAQDVVERLAERVTAEAIRRGVTTATALAGVPAIEPNGGTVG